MELLKEVLEGIRPDEKKVMKEVNITLKKLNSSLKKNKVKAKAVTGGSVAKGTFLKGDYDCDVFVKFDSKKYKGKDISKILGGVLKKSFKNATKVHGSRDYYHIKDRQSEFRYELVPVLDIKKTSDAINVTDCSPLHVSWVNKFPKMKEEIMLTKAFMKAAKTYGAESYIKGYSGHVVDIITIYYGGFLNLLKAASKWKHKEVVDYYNYHKGKALINLNKSKTQSPLIVVDPIQPDRNAAAALGNEKFEIFKRKASEFLRDPSKSFFTAEKIDYEKLQKDAEAKGRKIILIDIAPKTGKEDVVGAKILKVFELISAKLKENDFKAYNSGWEWDKKSKALLWFELDAKELAKTRIMAGPPVKIKKHYENFRKKHKKNFEKNGRVFAEVKREYTDAEKFIKEIINERYVEERVKSIILRRD